MKFTTILQPLKSAFLASIGFTFFASCGSYQYVGMSEDGIYGTSENATNEDLYNQIVQSLDDNNSNNTQGNSYYSDYFRGKANEYNNNETEVFTDIDSYNGAYDDSTENPNEDSYAGWGQNNDSQLVINIQTRPSFWGFGWGHPFYNPWGWNNFRWNNFGWNNWRNNWSYVNYGFWDPFFYNSWNTPFLGYGYGSYFYYGPYRSRNVAYINGHRNSRNRTSSYRTTSLANRSALSTVSRTRSNARRNTSSNTSRTYKTNRPTRTSSRTTTTKTRSVRNSDGTITTTRETRTSSPSRTRSAKTTTPTTRTTRTTRSRSTYSPARSSTRSSGGSRSRAGGSTTRKRN
jgi:hypothetical protein